MPVPKTEEEARKLEEQWRREGYVPYEELTDEAKAEIQKRAEFYSHKGTIDLTQRWYKIKGLPGYPRPGGLLKIDVKLDIIPIFPTERGRAIGPLGTLFTETMPSSDAPADEWTLWANDILTIAQNQGLSSEQIKDVISNLTMVSKINQESKLGVNRIVDEFQKQIEIFEEEEAKAESIARSQAQITGWAQYEKGGEVYQVVYEPNTNVFTTHEVGTPEAEDFWSEYWSGALSELGLPTAVSGIPAPISPFGKFIKPRLGIENMPTIAQDETIRLAEEVINRRWFEYQETHDIKSEDYDKAYYDFVKQGELSEVEVAGVKHKAWQNILQAYQGVAQTPEAIAIAPFINTISQYQQVFEPMQGQRQRLERLEELGIPPEVIEESFISPTWNPDFPYEEATQQLMKEGIEMPGVAQVIDRTYRNALQYLRTTTPELRKEMMEILPFEISEMLAIGATPEARARGEELIATGKLIITPEETYEQFLTQNFELPEFKALRPWFPYIYGYYESKVPDQSFASFLEGIGKTTFEGFLSPQEQALKRQYQPVIFRGE